MARRGDYRHRETKKAKKDVKKIPPVDILAAPTNVEVIGKGSKKKREEEVA
jgi:hypothetical protein